jgi:hypothetical protein
MMTTEASHNHRPVNTGAIGFFGLLGAWGYEVNDLMPELMNRDDFRAEELRYYLSLAPFGAGQAKNGQFAKAIGMGVAQAGFLAAASMTRDHGAKAAATFGALLSYAYGAYDGWVHHSAYTVPRANESKFSLLILPNFNKDMGENSRKLTGDSPLGLKMGMTWRF